MWREEISWDAIENSNGANGFLARGPYHAITRWHVLTVFQPLNPSHPPPLPPPLVSLQKQTYWCRGTLSLHQSAAEYSSPPPLFSHVCKHPKTQEKSAPGADSTKFSKSNCKTRRKLNLYPSNKHPGQAGPTHTHTHRGHFESPLRLICRSFTVVPF